MTVISDPNRIELFQWNVQARALGLELKGLRLSRGQSAYAAIKRQHGFRGSRESVLCQLQEKISKREQELGIPNR